ncbi:MAG: anthranilate phosphoribosyltransferase [Geminicoccaceae bacterium]|nr:anthranilate phosphoribosyltransferase [Geminicoccaceae bacterium]
MSADLQRFKALINKAAEGAGLTFAEASDAFSIMMSGDATPAQMAGLLMALRVRGETVDEITAGASVLRERMTAIRAPADAIDIVGTGGDGSHTFNISTASAIVAAGAGLTIAKHGNRGLSSRSGASDVLTALGVNIDAPMDRIEKAIAEAGIGFMMAPRHHGAMRHVAGPRVELGTRTIFNLLGPLANPARVDRQLTGVFSPEWLEPVAATLGKLGSRRAWIVHGHSGLDELSTTGPTEVAEWTGSEVRRFTVEPEEIGVERVTLDRLRGGTPEENARAIRRLLEGESGPFRDVVLLAVAAALVMAERAADLASGADMAREAIDSGRAAGALDRLVAITNASIQTDRTDLSGQIDAKTRS